MKIKPAASMRNISALKVFAAGSLGLLFLAVPGPRLEAENIAESVQKAIVDKFEETSKPLFNPESVDKQPKPGKPDEFISKINRKRADFYTKEKKRKAKFLKKVRESDWSSEKKQQKLADYHQDEMKRVEKFLAKQQKQFDKRQQTITL